MANCIICNEEIDFPLTCNSCNAPMCDTHHLSRNGKCDSCTNSVKLVKLRRSGLATYDTCPYLFKLTYIDEVEGINKSNFWAEVGNMLHEIFEKDSLESGVGCFDKLMTQFTSLMDDYVASNQDMVDRAQSVTKDNVVEKMRQRGRNGITNYLKYQDIANPIAFAEQYVELQINEGMPVITATIDRINKLPEGGYEVVDYKTGATFYGKQLSSDLQPPIYLMGAAIKLGELPKKFTFVFTDSERIRTYVQISEDRYEVTVGKKTYGFSLNETRRRIQQIFAAIENEQFNISQSVSNFYCENFCNAFYNNLCEGSSKQLYKNHW